MLKEDYKQAIKESVDSAGDAWHVLSGHLAGYIFRASIGTLTPEEAKFVYAEYEEAKVWQKECQEERMRRLYPTAFGEDGAK